MTTCAALERETEISERDNHVVIIAAAVAVLLGDRVRIRQIRETNAQDVSEAWRTAGKGEIQTAHQLRPMSRSMREWGTVKW